MPSSIRGKVQWQARVFRVGLQGGRREPLNKTAHTPFCIPSYLFKDLDKGVMRNKCECAEVQDEKHALFYCNCFERGCCEIKASLVQEWSTASAYPVV
eukprot:1161370-Pelagomonas_calceolata.AAC.10